METLGPVSIFVPINFNTYLIISVNKVILIGNVGKDPDVRYLDNHVCVARLSLATTERGYVTQNGAQIPDKTEWHRLVFWRGLAEKVEKNVHKGDRIYVEGSIRYSNYEDQGGTRHDVTEIFVDNMETMTPKSVKPDPAPQQPQPVRQPQEEAGDVPF